MYISKKLEWLRPFIKEIKIAYPKLKQLRKITIMRSSLTKRHRAQAECRPLDNGFYNIAIRTEYQRIDFNPLKVELRPYSKVDILDSLAHEISHIYHWDHTPERKIMESQINIKFMIMLKSQGYISEEDEGTVED